jgi:hypothetical protein
MRILKMLGHRLKCVFWWHDGHDRSDRPEPTPPTAETPPEEGRPHAS